MNKTTQGNFKAEGGTILSRLVILLSTLGVVLLNTHYLGTEGQGTASLINFGILLIVALSNFIGGGALAYLIPRMGAVPTLWPAMIWAIASSVIFLVVFLCVPVVPTEFIVQTCTLGLLQSIFIYFLQVLTGHMRFIYYNATVGIQAFSAFITLWFFYAILDWQTIYAFVSSLFVSFGITMLISLGWSLQHFRKSVLPGSPFIKTFSEMFRYGKYVQGGNILHLLNQRMNLILLENLAPMGRLMTGIFSLALYAAEAIWTVAKSLSIVQYAKISNSSNSSEHHDLTKKNLRLSLLVGSIACVVITFVPEKFYSTIFGSEVSGLRMTLLVLIPAILSNSASIIYAHYFSGIGLHRYNMVASALGFAGGLATGLWLIPVLGLTGAAAAASVAFTIQAIYFTTKYRKEKANYFLKSAGTDQ